MLRNTYYTLKPWIPRKAQLALRQHRLRSRGTKYADVWPIDEQAGRRPPSWPGWPDGKRFALVLTHDVESQKGHDRCLAVAELEKDLGFVSSFNFVPEGYDVSASLRSQLEALGFEIGVHGLKHDGKLFSSRKVWLHRVPAINNYIREWKASGFRAPAMHHNLAWQRDLDVVYDSSTFDTDPFEPQPDGVGTIFPFRVEPADGRPGFVELPYTLPQDFTALILLKDENLTIWKRKLAWITDHGGMALVITHPDYMAMNGDAAGTEEYPAARYIEFLEHIRSTYAGEYWNALPKDVAAYCRDLPDILRPARRKRVCMVAYTFYEQDNRVMRYAEALVRRGDEVDVIALNSGGKPPEEWIEGVRVLRIQKRQVDERRKQTYLLRLLAFLFRAMATVGRRHLQRKYDLVHTHNVPDFHVFTALIPKITGAKVILDIHDIVPEFYASKFNAQPNAFSIRLLKLVERVSTAFANHVIVSNHLWEQKLVSRSVRPAKVTTFLNYPDPDIFAPHSRTEHAGPFTLCYPGTLSWHQGLDTAIRAMALIHEDIPDAQLHIYGNGDQLDTLKALAAELGLTETVLFKGTLPLRELARAVAETDLGIVPKRKDSFGNQAFSTKIFEFMAMGIPVVVANTDIDTYYFNKEQVTFFRSGDECDLADKILELHRDPQRRTTQAAKAQELMKENSWETKRYSYYRLVDSLAD